MLNHRVRIGAAALVAAAALTGTAFAGGFQDQLPAGWSHAEINVTDKRGVSHTIILDRGRVQSVSAAAIVLRERDGSVVTVPVNPQTKVRVNGTAASLSGVRAGFRAFTFRVDGGAAKRVGAFAPRTSP
jgi:hypothetical protein